MSDKPRVGDRKNCPSCGHLSFSLSASALKRISQESFVSDGPGVTARTVSQSDGSIVETTAIEGSDLNDFIQAEEYGAGWLCSSCGSFDEISN